jgi:AcrR family transcriptional regulator
MPETVKLRARDAMRRELANAALDVVLDHGFDALTADDIAAAIGMSRATFFRQFGSKEGAVVAAYTGTSAQFADAFRRTARDGGGTRWRQLRMAVEPAVLFAEADPARIRRRLAFLGEHPRIFARLKQERVAQIDQLAQAMQDSGVGAFESQILANAAISTLDQGFQHWMLQETQSIRVMIDAAFAHLDAAGRPA